MHSKPSLSIRRLTTAAVLAAAIVLLTLISFPTPGGFGYINLGDAGVLFAGMLLGGGWGALCAGVASALSDVLLGYVIYAPATFVIKGMVALIAGLLFAKTKKKIRYASLFLAALIVPSGYLLYEKLFLLYPNATVMWDAALNLLQCMTGAVVATILGVMLLKTKLFAQGNALTPVCAEIIREPKNGPDVVLIAGRKQAALIQKAGDMLSVQGIMARLVVVDDPHFFDHQSDAQRERFLPPEKPFVRVEDGETAPKAIMQAAMEARGK